LNAIPEAVKALERAIEIDPRNAHALRNLAAISPPPSAALPPCGSFCDTPQPRLHGNDR
jgi:hypothetical protein